MENYYNPKKIIKQSTWFCLGLPGDNIHGYDWNRKESFRQKIAKAWTKEIPFEWTLQLYKKKKQDHHHRHA